MGSVLYLHRLLNVFLLKNHFRFDHCTEAAMVSEVHKSLLCGPEIMWLLFQALAETTREEKSPSTVRDDPFAPSVGDLNSGIVGRLGN